VPSRRICVYKVGMQEMMLVLGAAVPVFLIVGLGAFLRKLGVLKPEMDKGVMAMVVHVFFPCLILNKMLGVEVLRDLGVVFSAAGLGFGLIFLGTGLAWFVGPLLGLKKGSGRRTFAVSGGLQNYGFMAIPLMLFLFSGDDVMAVMFTHNLGVELAMWTIGLMLLSGSTRLSLRMFAKGPIIAVVFGLFLLQTGGDHLVPGVLRRVFFMMGGCAVPIALLLVGTALFDLVGKEKFDWKVGVGGVVVRLLMIPLLLLCVAKYFPLVVELKQVLVVQAAMPAAMFPIVLSKHYGGRTDVAVQVVRGNGKFSISGVGSSSKARESLKIAFDYFKAHVSGISASAKAGDHDYHLHVVELHNTGPAETLTLAGFVALSSGLLGKSIQSQMVVLGDMSLGGSIVPVKNLAESLQVAFDAGAKRVLLPMSSVSDIPSVPGELFAKFQTSFYSDPKDAIFKALGVE